MNRKHDVSFGVKVTFTLIKILLFILFFPYQIVINLKEGHYRIRSIALCLTSQRKVDEEGKKSRELSFRMPGIDVDALLEKRRKRKKAEKIAKKIAKKAEKAEGSK